MTTLPALLDSDLVAARFKPFVADYNQMRAVLISMADTPLLRHCEAPSILGAALTAAQLQLPLTKTQGCAYILPYGNQAQFQIGYKGWIQIALRTHQYKTINAIPVYNGQLISANPLTGHYDFDWSTPAEGKPIGYAAFFELNDGFSKILYCTRAEIERHAKRYSKTYAHGGGAWATNFDEMALKTVLSKLLRTYGVQTAETTEAYEHDQTVVFYDEQTGETTATYDDNPQTIIIADGTALGDEEG